MPHSISLLKSKALGIIPLSLLVVLTACQESKLLTAEPMQKVEPKFLLSVKNHSSAVVPIEIRHHDSLIFLTSQSLHFALELNSYEGLRFKWLINDQLYSTTPNLTFTTSPKFIDIPTQISQIIIDPLEDSLRTDFWAKIILNPNDSLRMIDSTEEGNI